MHSPLDILEAGVVGHLVLNEDACFRYLDTLITLLSDTNECNVVGGIISRPFLAPARVLDQRE